jgi:hypothetical protein
MQSILDRIHDARRSTLGKSERALSNSSRSLHSVAAKTIAGVIAQIREQVRPEILQHG